MLYGQPTKLIGGKGLSFGGGGAGFDILDLEPDGLWNPTLSYSGTALDATGIPDLSGNGRDLTYHTASGTEKCTAVEINGQIFLDLVGSGFNGHFYSDEIGALISAGTNVPWTFAGVVQLDAINNPTIMSLSNVSVADSYQKLQFLSDGSVLMENKNTSATTVQFAPTVEHTVSTVHSYIIRINGDGTASFWFDGFITDDEEPFAGPIFANARNYFSIGAYAFAINRNAIAEANGKFGLQFFKAAKLTNEECDALATKMLEEWH